MIEIIFTLITINYVIFIGLLIYGFNKVKTFKSGNESAKTTFSIVIPFRNEEKYFLNLLNSISKLDYPKNLFEIIVIDDASSDNSVSVFNKWRLENGLIQTTLLENLRLSNSPKKDAIARAVPIIENQWIVTTDADCVVPNDWLVTLNSYILNHEVSMIAGAVVYESSMNPLHYFQQMDLMSLQGTTIGSFGLEEAFMCNGANFAYKKSFFNELGGFTGNDNFSSGDDVFLLQKAVKKYPNLVHYLKNKESIVVTKPENNLFALFMQRVRWASKTGSYNNDFAKGLAVLVLLMNVALVFGFLVCSFWFVVYIFIIKFIVDYILLFKTNQFIRDGRIFTPIISSLIYPVFCSIVGVYSLFGNFTWKKRVFRK